jgi:hypothetical protein
MTLLTRKLLLDAFSKHGTLTRDDLAKPEKIGLLPHPGHLNYLLKQLVIRGHILLLNGAKPLTYTITKDGFEENNRLQKNH